jgi:hypothetical protein
LILWSERRDLNSGPPVPQTGALTGLRYAPPPYQRTSTLMSPGAQGPASCDGGRVDLGLRLAWLGDRAEFLLVACLLHAQIRSRRLEAAEWVAGIACTFAERPSSPRSPTAGA